MKKRVLLMILDGWGKGDKSASDAIFQAKAEYITSLENKYPTSELMTCGEHVGLPDGQMGNSEVGHLNLGAGRVMYQDLVKINRACEDKSIAENPTIAKAFKYAADNGKAVHLLGLMSDGGVHSLDKHVYALCDVTKQYGVKDVFIHAFMDGRDTDPKSGKGYLESLLKYLETSNGKLATVIGRYYAMDRDKRWDRVKKAYDLLVNGVGEKCQDAVAAIAKSYEDGVTDEFINPLVCVDENQNPIGTINEGDVVFCFNYRSDRGREITQVLVEKDFPEEGMSAVKNIMYLTMTPYDESFKNTHIVYSKDNVKNTLGEVLERANLKQLHVAETEKYAHVTFFFNGGREEPFKGESRILVASPKVATYDLQPEMGAFEIKDALVAELNKKEVDFVCLNFANGDMVGHTGVVEAVIKAIKAVDQCAKEVIEAAVANGYTVLVTADHGNADFIMNSDGSPNTAHSLNPVPFIVVSDEITSVRSGVLADVAPTVLKIMGVEQPADMTGKSLV